MRSSRSRTTIRRSSISKVEPRWEFKFLRRAMQDDPNIRLVTLLRSSQNKFYRQGIDKEEMLAEGFPKKTRRTIRL